MTETATPAGETPAASAPASTPAPAQPTTEQKTPAPSAAEPAEQVQTEPGQPSADTQDEGQGEDQEKSKPKHRWQDRVDRLTAQKHALTAENEALKAELDRLRKPIQAPIDRELSFEEQEALRLRQVVREERADEIEAEIRLRESRAADVRGQMLKEKVEAAAERIPDISEKVFDPTLPITPFAAEFISESDKGAEVAYYLASNRNEASRIAGLPVTQQAVELARLEARLNAAPQVRKVSQAPTPPPMVGGGQTAPLEKLPSEMSMAEYTEWYRKRNQRR